MIANMTGGEEMAEITRRAKTFEDKFGKFDSIKYMAWISKNVQKFENMTGRKVINNQEEFDDFLEFGEIKGDEIDGN